MRLTHLLFAASFALGTCIAGSLSIVPGTYYTGMEDGGASFLEGQGDFNDMIFSMTGSNLTLDTVTGQWFSAPNLSSAGSPFWNNASGDGAGMNVGSCIFGGGNCNIQGGPLSNGTYLASGSGGGVDDVLFNSGGGEITATLLAKITAWAGDTIGWYDPDDPNGTLHTIFSGSITPGQVITFDPSSVFGLWTLGSDGGGPVFLSNTSGLTHFAFFAQLENPTPEPDTLILMAAGILLFGAGLAGLQYRKRHAGRTL